MKEQWCKIPGFANYEISNLGQIFRIGKTKRTPVKVCIQNGYVYASLSYAPHKSKQVNVKHILDECFEEHIYKDISTEDLEGEIWKDVVGWEQSYEVSNFGRVRSKERFRTGKNNTQSLVTKKIKETYLDADGYERISLYENNQTKLLGVHRIVAEAFVVNPENKPQVNHIDGNKQNNKADNLEWVTQEENIQHSIETGLRNPKEYNHPVTRLSDNKQFESISELHREIGVEYRRLLRMFSDSDLVTIENEQYRIVK